MLILLYTVLEEIEKYRGENVQTLDHIHHRRKLRWREGAIVPPKKINKIHYLKVL